MESRKNLSKPKHANLDTVLFEWFKVRRSESVVMTGGLIKAQARVFHTQLGIQDPMTFSNGWLGRFIKRHGIRQLKICGERQSANEDAAIAYVLEDGA